MVNGLKDLDSESTGSLDKEKLRGIVQGARDIVQTYGDRYNALKELPRELNLLEELITRDQHRDIGKKLVQIGVILIAIPEPIVSNLGGATLITAGLALKNIKSHKAPLEDIYREIHKTTQDLNRLRRDLLTSLDL